MKSKLTAFLLTGCMLLSSRGIAAEAPAYLTDGVTEYPLMTVAQKQENVIGMPCEKRTFSYAFEKGDVQYSDFVFAPQPYSTGLKFSAEGTAVHTLTVQLMDKETGETVREIEKLSVMVGKPSEYFLPELLSLRFQRGYYIRLSSPSIKNAAGTFTVEVLGQEAETILRTMGVITGYENGQFIPMRNITRAEMCAMIAKTMGYTEVPPRQIFDDVPASHWASSYIAFCYEKGIIKGTGDNLFAPDATLAGEEMITMLVRMLGHAPVAEARGGYPGGYMIVAAQNEVTRGVVIVSGAPVTRKMAMTCMHNSLFAPLMVRDTKAEEETYVLMDGKGSLPPDTLYLRLANTTQKGFEK